MKLTHAKNVGELIEVLSQYKFSTPINTSCNECRHGWSGGSVSVEDFTNQTYGYIDLHINQSGYRSNLSRSDKEHKVIIMAHLLKYDMLRVGRMDDQQLHAQYPAEAKAAQMAKEFEGFTKETASGFDLAYYDPRTVRKAAWLIEFHKEQIKKRRSN